MAPYQEAVAVRDDAIYFELQASIPYLLRTTFYAPIAPTPTQPHITLD